MSGYIKVSLRYLLYSCLALWLYIPCHAQSFSLTELLGLKSIKEEKLSSYLSRRGYKYEYERSSSESQFFSNLKKQKSGVSTHRDLGINKSMTSYVYTTSSADEFHSLKEQLKKTGYSFIDEGDKPLLFQKNNVVVEAFKVKTDSGFAYSFKIEQADLPRPKEIIYADDLFALNSHEYLKAVFGENNVRKDLFIVDNNKKIHCSVLFPLTPREIIFLWQDEINLRKIASIRFGGIARTQGSQGLNTSIEQNTWQTKQGLYAGMTLKELSHFNGAEVAISALKDRDIYSFKTNGKMNFNNHGFILNCLNCSDVTYFTARLSEANNIQDKKIFISTIQLVPKNK